MCVHIIVYSRTLCEFNSQKSAVIEQMNEIITHRKHGIIIANLSHIYMVACDFEYY